MTRAWLFSRHYRRPKNLWGKDYTFHATVRIGSMRVSEVKASLAKAGIRADIRDVMKEKDDTKERVEPCEPLELLARIVSEKFDVVHYAGHGVFDEKTGRMGWLFDRDCVFSAEEIFRVRQVPRLVFANACFARRSTPGSSRSSRTRTESGASGSAWPRRSSHAALKTLSGPGGRCRTIPPASSRPLLPPCPGNRSGGRQDLSVQDRTAGHARERIAQGQGGHHGHGHDLGAYQHYGHGNTKLLTFRNEGPEMQANGPGG